LDLPAESKQTLCAAGQHWQFEDVNFAFIHPTLTDPGSDNNRSCVLLVYKGNTRVLLTGDIEADAEDALISRAQGGPFAPITLMSAPHHGSRTSSTQAFIDLLQPKHVVFAAGQRNRYGFPHIEVQLRYKMGGAILHNTASQGAISFELGSDGLIRQPSSWWTTNRRFWHGIANPDCWQNVASQSFILKQLALSQKGQTLCGK
jgi:competence protein ComEC